VWIPLLCENGKQKSVLGAIAKKGTVAIVDQTEPEQSSLCGRRIAKMRAQPKVGSMGMSTKNS
jgi:hypothetical protein